MRVRREILGDDSDSESGDDDDDDDDDDEEEEGGGGGGGGGDGGIITDLTEQDLVNLRRTIYLTIMSSAAVDECAHKLMKLKLREGQEVEIATMLIECCAQERHAPPRPALPDPPPRDPGPICLRLPRSRRASPDLAAGAHVPPLLRPARRALLPHRPRLPGLLDELLAPVDEGSSH